ncbi:MAG: hypothetical protein ABJB40_13405 [Acidobacteriota bacterium]
MTFFPIPLIAAIYIGNAAIALAAIQFPLFGFVLSYIREYKRSLFFTLISIVIWFHVAISLLVLGLVLISMFFG